jgi:V/A-type H+-transporting ATPase subunit F
MEYKIAIIGSHEEILGFKALGLEPFSVRNKEDVLKTLDGILERKDIAVVFITENWAEKISGRLITLRKALPAVVTIPNYAGSRGMGERKLRKVVEQAVGSDILFRSD